MKFNFLLKRELVALAEVEADSLSDAAEIVARSIEARDDDNWDFVDIGRYEVIEHSSGRRVLEVDDPECVTWTF